MATTKERHDGPHIDGNGRLIERPLQADAAPWDATLKSLNLTDMQMLYDASPEAARARNVAIGLPTDLKHERRAAKGRTLNLLHVANAAKHLERLPVPGEAFHVITKGNYSQWDLVPAVLQLAGEKIVELNMATLGFSRSNIEALAGLLDSGAIGSCSFICSAFFRSVDRDAFDFMHAALSSRGQRVASIRSHAKIPLFQLADGRNIVVESSANLRSCHNVEQFCMIHDRELLAFHKQWMDTLLKGVKNAPR